MGRWTWAVGRGTCQPCPLILVALATTTVLAPVAPALGVSVLGPAGTFEHERRTANESAHVRTALGAMGQWLIDDTLLDVEPAARSALVHVRRHQRARRSSYTRSTTDFHNHPPRASPTSI